MKYQAFQFLDMYQFGEWFSFQTQKKSSVIFMQEGLCRKQKKSLKNLPVNVSESICKGAADVSQDQKENSQGK